MKQYRPARGLFFSQLLLLAALVPAQADTITGTGWKGTASANFSNTGNWDSAAPNTSGSGDRNLFFGSAYATAGGTGSLTANNDLTGWHGYRVTFQDIGSDGSAANDKSFVITGNSYTQFDFSGNFPRIENDSYVVQTFNLTSGQTLGLDGNNGGKKAEIDPVNGDIFINAGTKVDLGDTTQLQIFGSNGHTLTFGGPISSSGATNLNSVSLNANSIVVFGATNTYGGDTFVNAGTLRCATNNAINNSTFIRLGDTSGILGANLNLDGGLNLAAKINVRAGSSGTKIIANTSSSTGNAAFTGNLFLDDNVTLYANTGGGNILSGSALDLKNQTLTISGTGANVINGSLTNSTGSGKLVINSTGITTLSGTNAFTGGTTLSSGTLIVNGNGAGSTLTNSAGILGGTGVVSSVTAILYGSTLQPGLGNDTATFTISNTLSLAGKAIFNLNRTNAQNANKISGLTSVAYGGTLTVTNLGPALQAGDTFTLFSSAAYFGSFTNLVLPTLTGALIWNTNNLAVNGSLSVSLSSVTLNLTSSKNPAGFHDSLTFTANVTPTSATGSIVFLNGATPFSTNTLTLGSATSTALSSLPRGNTTITAIYSGDSNYYGNTNSLSQSVTNHPPVASNAGYFRGSSTTWKIKLTDLATNATDVDGDSLTVTGFGISTNGVTLTTGGGYAFYSNASLVNDQFTYTVGDGNGGSATATINLTAQAFANGQSGTVSVSGSSATVGFAGIPGFSYTVQRSTNMVSWTGILTTNAPSGGVFNVIDTFSDLGSAPGSAYYRLQYNP